MLHSFLRLRAREIERLKLLLAKARRERFGQWSEHGKLLVEQRTLHCLIAALAEAKPRRCRPNVAEPPSRPPEAFQTSPGDAPSSRKTRSSD